MYVCMYVNVCLCMYMYVYVCLCMYMRVYVCICMYMYVMYVYVCICICMDMYVRRYICIYIYDHSWYIFLVLTMDPLELNTPQPEHSSSLGSVRFVAPYCLIIIIATSQNNRKVEIVKLKYV